ncbi:MAG: hypothetical protein ABIK23_05510 [candidate division WOR-3 bacterium]
MKRCVLMVAVVFVLTANVYADSLYCREKGSWPFGPSYAVALDPARNLAFVGSGGGVYILNVSNPSSPVKVSEAIHTKGLVYGLYYQANRLYIAAKEAGLEIWNVTNPEAPARLGGYDTPGYARGVAVSGNYAYVADGDAGLRIIEFYGQGIEEGFQPTANRSRLTATIVRNVLRWEKTGDRRPMTDDGSAAFLVDVTGRKVFDLKPGENDVRHLSPGVYFIRSGSGIDRRVVIAR